MGLKTGGVGHVTIPAAPAAGVSCTSGAANTFTGTAVVLSASTAAIFITGVHLESAAALGGTYVIVQLMIGGAGAETAVGQYLVPLSTGSTVALGYRQIYPPIPIANASRLSCKTADSVGSKATLVTVECIAQSNVVDDAIPVTTVTTVTNLTTYTGNTPQTGDAFARIGAAGAGLTAVGDTRMANLDAAVSSRTKPADTQAAVTTVTNLTNAPTAGDLTATMKASVTTAATAATPTAAAVTGAVGSVTGNVGGNVTGSVASVVGAVGSVTADVGITQTAADKVWGSAARTLTSFGTLVADAATAVWAAATRVLTAGTNIVLAKGTGVTGFNDIAATAIVSAGAITTSGGKVSGVILADTVTTYTGNTPQTGDNFVRIGVGGAGLTAIGDTRVANLDAAVTSRLAAGSYTAPDNTSIAGIKVKTDNLPASPADETLVIAATNAIMSNIGVAGAGLTAVSLAPAYDAAKTSAQASVLAAVKTQTDQLTFTAGNVHTNTSMVNGIVVIGTGVPVTDPWRAA